MKDRKTKWLWCKLSLKPSAGVARTENQALSTAFQISGVVRP